MTDVSCRRPVQAHRESRAVAASADAEDDQAFVYSVSEWPAE